MAARAASRGVDALRFEEMTRTERVMAAASLAFFDETFDLDILKLMPDIPYPFPRKGVHKPGDWRLIEPLDQSRSRFFNQRAEAVQLLRDELGFDTPIIVTLFSPLTEALNFAADRERFFHHTQEAGAVVHEALSALAENL